MTTPNPTNVEPRSWQDLFAVLIEASEGWVWCGQKNYEWELLTKLGRDLRQADPGRQKWQDLENSAIGYFMDRASSFLKVVPDEHDLLGWLALMQHYGAPTRLLDWSSSAFVALYFAYEQPTDSDAALYALDAYLARRTNLGSLLSKPWDHLGVVRSSVTDREGNTITSYPTRELYRRDRENEVLRWAIEAKSKCPLPTIPLQQDDRMSAQHTVLSLMGDVDVPVDIWFDKDKWEFPSLKPGGPIVGTDSTFWPLEEPGQFIKKIRLKPEWREQAMSVLATMGISASTMFPGLDGIGRATSGHLLTGRLTTRDVLTGLVL